MANACGARDQRVAAFYFLETCKSETSEARGGERVAQLEALLQGQAIFEPSSAAQKHADEYVKRGALQDEEALCRRSVVLRKDHDAPQKPLTMSEIDMVRLHHQRR